MADISYSQLKEAERRTFYILSSCSILKENATIGGKRIKKEYTSKLVNPQELK